MRVLLILIAINLMGCKLVYKEVKFRYEETDQLKMNVPKNFVFEGLQGDNEFEHRYWYSDSSLIYFTTFENTMNYEEIRKQGTYYDRFEALRSKDTLTLQGITEDGLYWKDKLLETGTTVGYSRVLRSRLGEFEKAISSANK